MLALLLSIAHGEPLTEVLADADVLLQPSTSAQSGALRAATGSPYTHVGLAFRRDGAWQVIEAVGPVVWTPLDAWIARGRDDHVVALRLADPSRLDAAAVRTAAEAWLGVPYDPLFAWSDERIYCSELVYKAYDTTGVQVGDRVPLRSFDLTSPEVEALVAARVRGELDLDEPVVAPASLLADPDLVVGYSTDLAHPPGPCVAIPDTRFSILEHRSAHGFDAYLREQIDLEADYRYTFEPLSDVDLDGDGVTDARVPVRPADRTCQTEVQWDLYVRRGTCGHLVGRVRGHPVTVAGGTLSTREEPQGPQDATVDLTYGWDGTVFAPRTEDPLPTRCSVHRADCEPMTRFTCTVEPGP